MSTPRLIELNRRLDTKLNEFALTADASGQYPWQAAQQQKQQRRRVGGALVGAAIGAGAYGAKKLNARYGTQGMDGMKVGAADLVNRADDAIKGGVAKAKTAATAGMAKMKTAAAPVLDPLKRKLAAGKLSMTRGVAQKQGMGKMISRVGRALIHASRADVLVELEARLDGALQEFGAFIPEAQTGHVYDPTKDVFSERNANKRRFIGGAVGLGLVGAAALHPRGRKLMGDALAKYTTRPASMSGIGQKIRSAVKPRAMARMAKM